jgi:hypothetical protein
LDSVSDTSVEKASLPDRTMFLRDRPGVILELGDDVVRREAPVHKVVIRSRSRPAGPSDVGTAFGPARSGVTVWKATCCGPTSAICVPSRVLSAIFVELGGSCSRPAGFGQDVEEPARGDYEHEGRNQSPAAVARPRDIERKEG